MNAFLVRYRNIRREMDPSGIVNTVLVDKSHSADLVAGGVDGDGTADYTPRGARFPVDNPNRSGRYDECGRYCLLDVSFASQAETW